MLLVGYINPAGAENGFMIPVFEEPPANGIFVQKRTERSKPVELVIFDVDDVEGYTRLDNSVDISLENDKNTPSQEYYFFKYEEEFFHGFIEGFSKLLHSKYKSLSNYPVLKFSVSKFLKIDADLPANFTVAYTHIGTSYSKEAADNWQDTQVFLPKILETLAKYPSESRNAIEDIEVKSNGAKVEITLFTANDYDFSHNTQSKFIVALKEFDSELDVKLNTVPISKSWERIAENSQEINEEEMTDDLQNKLQELAKTYTEFDPVKQKQSSNKFRTTLFHGIPSITDRIVTAFGDNIRISESPMKTHGQIDGMNLYSKSVNVTVLGLASNGVNLTIFAKPLGIHKTLFVYGSSVAILSNSSIAKGTIEIDNKNSKEKIETIYSEMSDYFVNLFIQEYSDKIEGLK